MINFIIGLSGIDPKTGQEFWLAKIEKQNETECSTEYLAVLIDKVLDESAKLGGDKGLEGLRNYHAQLLVGI